MISVNWNGLPTSSSPPSDITTATPACAAVVTAAASRPQAESSALAASFTVAVRAFTAAGQRGLTTLPSGSTKVSGARQPPLLGACGASVRMK